MSTSIAFPSDAVVKGATEIQSTTFALVAADYVRVDLPVVIRFIADNGSVEGLPDPRNKGANGLPEWQFFRRKDLTGADAAYNNLVGVKTVVSSRTIPTWDPSISAKASVPIQVRRSEAYNWHVALMTLDSGAVIPIWTQTFASYSIYVDPAGVVLYGDGNHRSLEEATAFLLTRVAANKPTNEKAIAVAYASNPLA
jgi:hypothetical protein